MDSFLFTATCLWLGEFLVFGEKVGERFLWRKQLGQKTCRCYPRSALPAADLRRDGKGARTLVRGLPVGNNTC